MVVEDLHRLFLKASSTTDHLFICLTSPVMAYALFDDTGSGSRGTNPSTEPIQSQKNKTKNTFLISLQGTTILHVIFDQQNTNAHHHNKHSIINMTTTTATSSLA